MTNDEAVSILNKLEAEFRVVTQMFTATTRIKDMLGRYDEIQRALPDLEKSVKDRNAELASVGARIKEEEEVARRQASARIETTVANLTSNMHKVKQENDELVKTHQNFIVASTKEREDIVAEVAVLKAEVKELQEKRDKFDKEIAAVRQKLGV